MAGRGSRFISAGYKDPKPFIKFRNGQTLIEVVTENIRPRRRPYEVHYLALAEHVDNPKYTHVLDSSAITKVEKITQGAACTVLLAKNFIDKDEPLIIANSDQYIDFDIDAFICDAQEQNLDGSIVTFTATEKKWSFAKLDLDGFVTEVAEKQPISDIATVGIYYWKRGSDFVTYANQMIEKNIRVNGEFYVCPVFNEAIADNKKIGVFHIDAMYGFGTPEDWKRNEKLFDH